MTQPLQARAANIAANVHYHAGRFDQARTELQRAQALATEEGEQRTAYARLRALQDEVSRRTLGRVLFGDSPTRGVDAGLVILLITRFAGGASPARRWDPTCSAGSWSSRDPEAGAGVPAGRLPRRTAPGRAARPGALPPLFLIECHRLVGDAAFRAGDLAAQPAGAGAGAPTGHHRGRAPARRRLPGAPGLGSGPAPRR